MPGPSLWLNAGAGRPFSTISVKSLLAVLIRERKWHQLFLSIMSGLTRDGIEEKYWITHWIDSGSPVNVTDLSGNPPLSVTQNRLIH